MSEQSGVLQEGARRVWKSQRIVWWLFLVNLLLAFLTTRPLSARLEQVTDHSLQSQRLVTLTGVVNSDVDRMLARSLASQFGAFSVSSQLKTDAEMREALDKSE